ncbi:conserved hypothetical protein [Methanosarcina acetivorans C2A]|uniref:Methanogenesis regulatory protein FilR1 middle domain-containing protein n=1 Tax=Methanosarcina acetivorans (strain ATCC 35395 / DSM 2834 / JCM 12185 / C2A) TaxID=188937 RepID=Q8TTR9_METAC|nr:conserved hypothetical protein [Methanosarcina acetivorans C2A]
MTPQINKLVKTGLMAKEGDTYRLSGMGPVVVANMERLLGTLELYEENMDYWKNHDLSSLPPYLKERIHELGSCRIVPLKKENIMLRSGFLNEVLNSSKVLLLASVFHSDIPFLYSELLGRGIDTNIIITETAFKSMQKELLEEKDVIELKNPLFGKLFEEYRKEAGKLLNSENPDVFIYPGNEVPASILLTDTFFSIIFYEKNGNIPRQGICSWDPGALSWGEELFMYYKCNSPNQK